MSTIVDEVPSANQGYRIKAHPRVEKTLPVYGYIRDCKTGKLVEEPAATSAGQPG